MQEIENNLRQGIYKNNPHKCAEDRSRLSGEYSFYSAQLEDVLSRKPAVWNTLRPNHKSDTACERAYEQTEDGINETGLRLKLKRIEKMMSGMSSLIKIAEGEARNQF